MNLTEKQIIKDGIAYACICNQGMIPLNRDMGLNLEDMPTPEVQDEITRVYEDWQKSYIPLQKDGSLDRKELERKLTASLSEGKKSVGEELKRKNSQWIEPAIARMVFDFNYGLYGHVSDRLYSDYKAKGGEDTEPNLIRKIQLFNRIYDTDSPESLSKPNGTDWKSEDEIWECWTAFAGSEPEAKRVCQTMDAVFRPLYKEFQSL